MLKYASRDIWHIFTPRRRSGDKAGHLYILAILVLSAICRLPAESPAVAQPAETRLKPACREAGVNPGYLIRRCFSERQLSSLMSAVTQRRKELGEEERETADGVAEILGVDLSVLRHWFRTIGDDDIAPEDMAAKLAEHLKLHKDLMEELKTLRSDADSGLDWGAILSMVETGQYDAATALAVVIRDRVIANSEKKPDNRESRHRSLSASEAVIGQIALLQSKYAAAIEHFRTASDLVIGDDEKGQRYQEAAADALYLQAGSKWDRRALQQAVEIYKGLLAVRPLDEMPELWAETQVKLGNSLMRLGGGEGGATALNDAVSAYRAALRVQTKERDPAAWARAQARLAGGLFRLGVRRPGNEELLESIAAYRLALDETSRENAPEEWVSLQNDVGATLWSLGTREKGRHHLEEAVNAFSEALEGIDAGRSPRDWGATQNNLGAALFALAERETGDASLTGAIEAFKASLSAYQEASAIYFVVGVKKNLARAEAMLRQRRTKKRRR